MSGTANSSYQRPGVFIEEVPASVRPIEGVATAVLGLAGMTAKGDASIPQLVTSWEQFVQTFGGYHYHDNDPGGDEYLLPHCAYDFFNNGGTQLYVARVLDTGVAATVTATGVDGSAGTMGALKISAINEGLWGNDLSVTVAHVNVVTTTGSSTNGSYTLQLASVEGIVPGMILKIDDAADEYCAVVAVDVFNKVVTVANTLNAHTDKAVTSQDFNIYVWLKGQVVESFLGMSIGGKIDSGDSDVANKTGTTYVENVINGRSNYIEVAEPGTGWTTIAWGAGSNSNCDPRPSTKTNLAPWQLASGDDGDSPSHYFGAGTATTTALEMLNGAPITLAAVPDMHTGAADNTDLSEHLSALGAYCATRMDCIGIGTVEDAANVTAVTSGLTVNASSYLALFAPWGKRKLTSGRKVDHPLVGAIAGIFARTDRNRGVFKAPAGNDSVLYGFYDLALAIGNTDNESLFASNINPLRYFPGVGQVIWGSRTMSAAAEWKYIPVRRYAIFLEQSILRGISWSVFEPNDSTLWAKLRLNIAAFLMTQFRQGALKGATPAEAFYVRCDSQTNPQSVIDQGQVVVEVGYAPQKPAEFVRVRMAQWDGGALLEEIGG